MENRSRTTCEEGARVSVRRKTYVHICYWQSRHDSSTPDTRRKDSQRRFSQQCTLTRANEDIPFKCSHTTAYDINVCILIRWHTLIYVRGTLGIHFVRSTYADLCRCTLFSYAEAIVCRSIDQRLLAYEILYCTCMIDYYKQDRLLINWQFIANTCLKRRVALIDKML